MNKFKLALLVASCGVVANSFSMDFDAVMKAAKRATEAFPERLDQDLHANANWNESFIITDEEDPKKEEKEEIWKKKQAKKDKKRIDAEEAALGGSNIFEGWQKITPHTFKNSNKPKTSSSDDENAVFKYEGDKSAKPNNNDKVESKMQRSQSHENLRGTEKDSTLPRHNSSENLKRLREDLQNQNLFAQEFKQCYEKDEHVDSDDEKEGRLIRKRKAKAPFQDATDKLENICHPIDANDEAGPSNAAYIVGSSIPTTDSGLGVFDRITEDREEDLDGTNDDNLLEGLLGEEEDEEEDEISGHPQTPVNENRFSISSIWNYFWSENTDAVNANDNVIAPRAKSRFARNKGKIAAAGIGLTAAVGFGLIAKSMLSKNKDTDDANINVFDELDIIDNDFGNQISEDVAEMGIITLKDSRSEAEQESDEFDVEKNSDKHELSDADALEGQKPAAINYNTIYADCHMYVVPLRALSTMLNLNTIEKIKLKKSLETCEFEEVFDQMLERAKSEDMLGQMDIINAIELAKIVLVKFVEYQLALAE